MKVTVYPRHSLICETSFHAEDTAECRWVGPREESYHWCSTLAAIHNDGDILVTLDVLAKQVGILGIFSDLGRHADILCELHGLEIVSPAQRKAGLGEITPPRLPLA